MNKAEFIYRYLTAFMRTKPDFLVAGAQKAGTSSLSKYLGAHPQIYMPAAKELHYFDYRFPQPLSSLRYKLHFHTNGELAAKKSKGKFLQGEATPYYLFHPLAAARAYQYNKDLKIIILLRDPLERAISHYKHNIRKGYEQLSFEEAIYAEEKRLNGEEEKILANSSYNSYNHKYYSYISRAAYDVQVERWRKWFGDDKMLVMNADDLFQHTKDAFFRICNFLNVDMVEVKNLDKVYNKGLEIPEFKISERCISFINEKLAGSNEAVREKYKISFSNSMV